MAVEVLLGINGCDVGFVEVRRVDPVDVAVPDADVVCTYDVRRDGCVVGQVKHRYGDGVWQLAASATALIAEVGG